MIDCVLASLHRLVTLPWLVVEQLGTIVQAVLDETGLLPQDFSQTSNKAVPELRQSKRS